jgi:hypothetical protein
MRGLLSGKALQARRVIVGPKARLLRAAPVLSDDDDADDAVRDRLTLPPQLLQPVPRFHIDRYLPVAVRQAPPGLPKRLGRALDQDAALLGDFNVRHRLR